MKSLYLLVLLLPLIGAITRTYQNCHRLEWAKEAKIYWTFDHAQNIAHIGMEAIAQDFLAVSFSKEGTIISGTEDFLDGWMVYVDNGECLEGCLWDTYTPPDGQPIKDLNNDLSDVLISKQGDLLVAEFSRRIDTGDKDDHPLRPFGSQFVFWSTIPKSSIQANLVEIPIVYDGSLLVHFDTQSSCEEMVHQKRRANTYTSPDGIWTGSWQVDATQTYIDVTMSGKTTGWISFCFSNIGKMTVVNAGDNTDCYTGWVNGTAVVLNDEQSVSYLQPKPDTANGGTNDATNVAGSLVNGVTTISFRRKLKTADALDIVITNTNMYLSWGYGPTPGNAQGVYPIHTFAGAQYTPVNFFGGAVPTMATSASAPPAATGGNTFMSPKGNFKLTWAIDLKAAMVTFTMTGTVNGWIGLGYGPQPLMKNQDMIAGWIDDNTMKTTLLDSYSLDYLQPRDDVTRGGTYDVTLVSSTQAGGSTTIAYKRKLVTGDANDQDITNTMMYLTWGVSPADGNANGQYGIHSDYGAASVNFFTGAVAATPNRIITSGQILLIVVGGILAVWIIIRMIHKCIKAIKRKKAKIDNNYTVKPVTFVEPINLGNGIPTPNPSYGGSSSGSSSGSNSSNSPMLDSRQPSTNYPQMNSSQPYGSGPIQDNHSTRAIPRQPGDPSPNPKFRPAPPPGGRRALPSRPGMGPAPPRPYMSPPLPVQNNTFTGAYFRGSEIVYPKHIQDKTLRRTMKEMKKIEIVKDNTQMQIDANIIDEKGSGNAISRFFKSIYEARVPRTQLTFGYLLVVIIYVGINVACSFYDPQLYVAVGSLAGANGLLVALPATRNSIFVWLLGIPFDKTILYHRWLGRFTIFLVLLHMILSFVSAGGIAAIASMSARTVIIFGYVSFAASVILFVTSLEYFRRNKYEMFHFTHYFFFIFYIFGAVHETEMLIYSVIALGIYVLDKLIRIFWGSFPMKTTELRYKEGDIIQVRFGKHMMARLFGLHKVGQYMFVNFPTISPLEWHPYSVSSGPDEKTVEIHIKALGDHTRKLVNSARGKQSMWVRTDGPYGNHKINYRRFPVLILAAGGIGVTPCMGLLKDVFRFGDLDRRAKPRHVSLVQKVYFIWVVQNMEQFGWFSEEIQWCNEASKKGNGLPDLEIQIYVTKSDGELNGFFKKGRPDMFGIFDKIVRSHDDKASTVFTCGPRKLVNSCWDATSEQRRGGATIHFHHETFEF